MLDARRTALQLPLMREVTALQKNFRTLQDPGTSSGSVTTSGSGSSSAGGAHKRSKTQTFIGDPHQDAQALARELSGKLAKSANTAPSSSHGTTTRGESNRNPRIIEKMQITKRNSSDPEMELGVRERIQRIESALDGTSARPTIVSGELRREGLPRELKAANNYVLQSEDQQRRSSVSSLSQLLLQGNYDPQNGNSRSAANLLRMVQDEERRSQQFAGECLFQSDEGELSSMEMEMSRPRPESSTSMAPITPLTLRGKETLKKPRIGRGRKKKKPASARLRVATRQREQPTSQLDDELAVSELPNGCGSSIPWDWSRIQGAPAFATVRQSPKRELHDNPVQSVISSLDSDANALPLVIGDDAHDSDLAGYFRSRETPQVTRFPLKRNASLQNAVKDIPGMITTATPPVETAHTHAHGKANLPVDTESNRTLTQKYRPKNFKEIVGQSVVVKSLTTAILKSKVAPVYLFMGPRGTGKTSTARVFATGLNCLSPDLTTRPCGICRECGTMALNRSADVRHIDATENADLASMRAMMVSFTPTHARYKVFIVEGCDALSAEIWNSFLKMLEEPPHDVVFVLITTDAERLPATATSRCQKFHFLKVKESDIVTRLEFVASRESMVVEPGALALIAARSDGSLRDAEILLDQLCLVHKTLSIAAVRELIGLLPVSKVLDLLDYALSANTVSIVRTLRELLAAGVEPLALVSQLGLLITDILVGSLEVDRDSRQEGSFFTRIVSEKEEHQRLRQALKILSEAEKQLRAATDGATWLTAALLQFAPDRSFLPSSGAPSPEGDPSITGCAPSYPVYRSDNASDEHPLVMDAPNEIQAPEDAQSEGDPALEIMENMNVSTLSEQKLEEAWAGDQPQQQVADGELETGGAAAATSVQFQLFRDEALGELWKRVVWEVTPRNLKNMLQTQGRLVAAAVAIDSSCAVVELEFDYARDKHKAERSWRSICIAFQAILSTAVELRIALSDVFPEESQVLRETIIDDTPPTSSAHDQHKTSPETVKEPTPEPTQEAAPPARRHRRRGTRARRHRHATEILETELGAQFSSDVSGIITPRRRPPRRRKVKRAASKPAKPVVIPAVIETEQLSGSLTREIWDALSMNWKYEEKKLLSTMMEEPQSEIDDLEAAQKKILKQRHVQFRSDSTLTAVIDRRTSLMADLDRGLPAESSFCWKRASPPQSEFLMRKSRVKSVRKAQGKAMFLRLVPCATTHVTPASTAPIPQLQVA